MCSIFPYSWQQSHAQVLLWYCCLVSEPWLGYVFATLVDVSKLTFLGYHFRKLNKCLSLQLPKDQVLHELNKFMIGPSLWWVMGVIHFVSWNILIILKNYVQKSDVNLVKYIVSSSWLETFWMAGFLEKSFTVKNKYKRSSRLGIEKKIPNAKVT